MKKIFNKLQDKAVYGLAFALSALASTFPGYAAPGDNLGKSVIDESKNALSDLLDSVVSLLQVVMGLGAIVVLAIVIFKIFKGDREAAEKLAWWVAGLTLGFVLLTVVANLVEGV